MKYIIFRILNILKIYKKIPIWLKGEPQSLRKKPSFQLISRYGHFVERHSFHIVSGDSSETMRKLCLTTKFP